jgi:heptosyltransferase-2
MGIEPVSRTGAPSGQPGTKPNLLVFEMRLMGDAIMSLPFIRAAQEKYRVFVCCQPAVSDVFRLLLPEEQVIPWRPPWIDEAAQYDPARSENVKMRVVLKRLQDIRAQTALCVWADTRVHVLMAMTGAEARIGFPMEKKNFYASELAWRRRKILAGKAMNFLGSLCFRGELLTQKLHRNNYFQHHVEDWRQMAEELDLKWSTALPWFSPPAISLPAHVSDWLQSARSQRQKIWLLHPGARTPERRWPMERFCELAEQMFIHRRIPLIIIDPMESPLPREWAPGALIYRPGSLVEFFSLVNAVDCVVCNDTGVSHVSAALGKRVVCVFGPDLPQWLGPYHNLDLVVQKDACPYRPCFDRCVMPSYTCLEAVTVEMVQRMIEKVHTANLQRAGSISTTVVSNP